MNNIRLQDLKHIRKKGSVRYDDIITTASYFYLLRRGMIMHNDANAICLTFLGNIIAKYY